MATTVHSVKPGSSLATSVHVTRKKALNSSEASVTLFQVVSIRGKGRFPIDLNDRGFALSSKVHGLSELRRSNIALMRCCASLESAGSFGKTTVPSHQPNAAIDSKESSDKLSFLEGVDSSTKPRQSAKKLITGVGAAVILLTASGIYRHPALAAAAGRSAAIAAGGRATNLLVKTEFLSSAWTGLVAGFLHTLTGPDHLAALAPLSIGRSRIESAAVGALWGCGHDAGQVIFGILFLLLKGKLQVEFFRAWGARIVGITLLVIGAMGIKEALQAGESGIPLEDGDDPVPVGNIPVKNGKNFGLATFATGIVHGLQPDALLMILPALALPSRIAGAAFLGMFLVGTIVAMGSYTAFIGSCSSALKKKVPRITEGLSWGSSIIAIALGLAFVLSEFLGINLF